MRFSYRFPVVKGVQASKPYFIAMVPLETLGKLFPTEDEYVLPEYRAQRKLNEARIPEIKRYIIENSDNYVFSALAASIDGGYKFIPIQEDEIGVLEVDMNAKFLINDGQHRKAAIIAALEEKPELGKETISVVFFEDAGLKRSQQMFTDLNKHAVKTSNSIAELYDSRDEIAVITRNVISEVSFLNEYVDKERDILGKFSSALFTLNTFYTANKRIIRREKTSEELKCYLIKFWDTVAKHMIPWNELVNKGLSKMDLREQYIASQAVVIQAFGKVGAQLYDEKGDLEKYLCKVEDINWKRNWDGWRLRVIRSNGRMINNEAAITLTAIVIKKVIGLQLNEDEEAQEKIFLENKQ